MKSLRRVWATAHKKRDDRPAIARGGALFFNRRERRQTAFMQRINPYAICEKVEKMEPRSGKISGKAMNSAVICIFQNLILQISGLCAILCP